MPTSVGIAEVRTELKQAFAKGLKQHYGDAVGSLLAEVAVYGSHGLMDLKRLRKSLEADAAAIVVAVVQNRTDPSIMVLLRNQIIGSAIVEDKEAVKRWATEARTRCLKVGGDWAQTAAQWQWVTEHVDRFVFYARQLKYFMSQI